MTTVIVNGAFGKMGQLACQVVKQTKGFKLAKQLGRADDLAAVLAEVNPDIVIDFTVADAAFQNAEMILQSGAHPIIGTSGLSESDVEALSKYDVPGAIIPNFSIGAVLMMQFSMIAAKYFPRAEIVEKHHEHKKDAPSGTSIRTAEIIASMRDNEAVACQRNQYNDVCGIPIHSIRQAGFLASQDVIFGHTGETLTISHQSIHRDCFAEGIALCLQNIMSLDHLVYGLEYFL